MAAIWNGVTGAYGRIFWRNTELHTAAALGQLKRIQDAFERNKEHINALNDAKRTPLDDAIYGNKHAPGSSKYKAYKAVEQFLRSKGGLQAHELKAKAAELERKNGDLQAKKKEIKEERDKVVEEKKALQKEVEAIAEAQQLFMITSESSLKFVETVNPAYGLVEDRDWNWTNFPVVITLAEKRAMNFEHIMKLLKGEIAAPSMHARLTQDKLPPCIAAIDKLFRDSLVAYQVSLGEATKNEIEEVRRIPIQKDVDKTKLNHERSHHRILWFKEVDSLEKERLSTTANMIQNRSLLLFEEMERHKAKGTINIEKLEELKQLAAIAKEILGGVEIKVGSQSLQTYVESLAI